MTKKNLVAVLLAFVMSITLSIVGNTAPQAQAKSVTSEAAQSVTKPSTYVASSDYFYANYTKRTTVTKVPTVRKAPKAQVKPKNVLVRQIVGVRASAWRGKGYNPRWENVRMCIVHRESRGVYTVHRERNGAAGAYQFLPAWQRGLAIMIGKPYLRKVPIWKWSRVDQDHGWWAAWRNGAGRKHWNLKGNQCW
jgi:hypothetical protein